LHMDPFTIAGVALGGLQLLGGLFGSSQQKRPEWKIPGASYEQLAQARQTASATVRPGNQNALDSISKASASALGNVQRAAGSGQDVLKSAEAINRNEQNAVANNNAQNAQFSFNAKQNLQGILGNFAQQQREEFIKNQWEPYMQSRDTTNSLVGSGIQNVFGTLQGAQQNKLFAQYMTAAR
jgi:hypothetical protein